MDSGKPLAFVDHKWREVIWKVEEDPVRSGLATMPTQEHKALPRLWASSPDLEEISLEAWDALRRANAPVRIFRAGGLASRLETNDEGYPIVKTLTVARLRQEMAIAAGWYRKDNKGNEVPCRPPVDVITNMLAQPDVRLPMLERIVEAPAFAPDGSIQTEPGYHEAARRFYHGNGLMVRPVPTAPSGSDVGRAVRLLSELLIDFPFVSEADRLNAIAAMLGADRAGSRTRVHPRSSVRSADRRNRQGAAGRRRGYPRDRAPGRHHHRGAGGGGVAQAADHEATQRGAVHAGGQHQGPARLGGAVCCHHVSALGGSLARR
jgi:hypothetical protein